MHPDRTPLAEWCAAAFAVLVDCSADGEALDKAYSAITAPLPSDQRTDLDRDTWGMSEAAQAAQARLLAGWGAADQ